MGENNLPSRAAFNCVSATLSAARSLSRCALSCALSALVSALWSALMRRASFFAASLASSFAFALMARASAFRVARVLRLNRLIPAASRSSLGLATSSRCALSMQHNTIVRALICAGPVPPTGRLRIASKSMNAFVRESRDRQFCGWRCV